MSSSLNQDLLIYPKNWLAEQKELGARGFQYLVAAGLLDALLAISQAYFIALTAHQLMFASHLSLAAVTGLLATLLLRTANSAWRASTAASTEARITLAIRELIAKAMLRGKMSQHTTGAASNALLEQSLAVGRFHANFAPQQKIVAYAMVIFLIVAFATDWMVGLIFMVTAPLIPLFMALVGSGAQKAADTRLATMDFLGGYFLDRLKGALTLRAFGREVAETKAVDKANAEFRKSTMGVLKIAFLTSTVLELFSALAVALVAVYVGLHLLNLISIGPGPKLDFRTGLFLLLLAPEFYAPMRQMAASYHDRAGGLAAAKVLAPVLGDVDLAPADAKPLASAPTIEVRDLSYRYDTTNTTIFEGVNLYINSGECLIVRGDSGTGKSTFLKLLAGLLTPQTGTISYQDNVNTSFALPAGSYAWVSQKPWFIHGTVADNLLQANPKATPQELEQTLRLCGLAHIDLHAQLDEQGVGLSGGEGRRLGIARAVLSRAPLWFMDEPTAELDTESEADIVALIRQFKGQHTLVIATHSEQCATLADTTLWVEPIPTQQGESNE